MNKHLIKLYKKLCSIILKPMLVNEVNNPRYTDINERVMEYYFALKCLSLTLPKTILDVGSGSTSFPHVLYNCGFDVYAIDKIEDYWTTGFLNRHFYVANDDVINPKVTKKFDLITCISVIEHIPDFNTAMKNMVNLLNSKGHIILTFPYNEEEYVHNIYDLLDLKNSYICQIFSPKEINHWTKSFNLNIIGQEFYTAFTGNYWDTGERISPRLSDSVYNRQLCCLLLQKKD